jgi:hypothetical protein
MLSRKPASRLRYLPIYASLVGLALAAAGCGRAPVRPWERGYLTKRAMQFDRGPEGLFRQHWFSSREGAEGGYGTLGGGCGCN